MKQWYKKKSKLSHDSLLKVITSPQDYKNVLRMDHDIVMNLLTVVEPLLEKRNTKLPKALPAHSTFQPTICSNLL